MLFSGLCFHAFIYLVLLVDGLSHPYFFFIKRVFIFLLFDISSLSRQIFKTSSTFLHKQLKISIINKRNSHMYVDYGNS